MVFDEAEGLAVDLLAQIVGAHTNVGAVGHTEGGVGDGVSEHVVGGGNADGGHDSGGSVGTIGVGVTESGVSGVSGVGVQKGGIGISLTLVEGVAGGAGDGHVGGVDARGGLQAGVVGIGEGTVGIGIAAAESSVSGVGVQNRGIGVSLSGDNGYKSRSKDVRKHDATMIQL